MGFARDEYAAQGIAYRIFKHAYVAEITRRQDHLLLSPPDVRCHSLLQFDAFFRDGLLVAHAVRRVFLGTWAPCDL